LVGPSTAVTPAPRARASRLLGEENESAIGCPGRRGTAAAVPSLFCTTMQRRKSLWLSCGTSLERIAAESLTRPQSDFVHCHMSHPPLERPLHRVTAIWPF
jgi:hypothetical protein